MLQHIKMFLICCWSSMSRQNCSDRRGMDSTRPLKVSCGIWHHDASSRSFKSCKLRGEASMDRTCLSSTSHRCSIGLRSGEFGGQVNTLHSKCHVPQTMPDQCGLHTLSCWNRCITHSPLACLLPTVHPGAICSPGKRWTCTQPCTLQKKTGLTGLDDLLPLMQGPVWYLCAHCRCFPQWIGVSMCSLINLQLRSPIRCRVQCTVF